MFKKGVIISTVSIIAMLFGVANANALELSGAVTQKTILTEDTKLTDDVTLERELVVESGKNITIDLNGHNITAANYENSDYYAIDNGGTLTITDTGNTKGSISCTKTSSSCIRNTGNITLNGVNAKSTWLTLKNEPSATMTIINSSIESTYKGTNGVQSAIRNFGTLEIDNSNIKQSGRSNYPAIYVGNADDNNIHTTSKTTIKNSTVGIIRNANTTDKDDEVTITNSTLTGNYNTNPATKSTISGNMNVQMGYIYDCFINNLDPGTTVTVTKNATIYNSDASMPMTLKEGVTINVNDVKLSLNSKRTLNVKGNIILNNNSTLEIGQNAKLNLDGIIKINDTAKITNKNATSELNAKYLNKTQNTYYGDINQLITNVNLNDIIVTEEEINGNLSNTIYQLIKQEENTYIVSYKNADYTKVEEALKKAQEIDSKLYTKESYQALLDAINSVIEGKNITEQELVDSYAANIINAINNLVKKEEKIDEVNNQDKNENVNKKENKYNTKTTSSIENPSTADNIIYYLILGILSMIGLISIAIYTAKEQN